MRMAKTMTLLIVFILVGGTLAAAGAYHLVRGDIYNGGWESQNSLVTITVNGVDYDCLGPRPSGATAWGAAYCAFDPDEPTCGLPDLTVQITSPREYVINNGEWVPAPAGQVFQTINKKVTVDGKEYNFFWDHHVFFFDLKVIATGQGSSDWWDPVVHGEGRNMEGAIPAAVNTRLMFEVDPWVNKIVDSFQTDDATYRLDESRVWSGVMSVSIADIEAGYSGHLDDPGYSPAMPGLIKADQVGKLNMFTDDGAANGLSTLPSDPVTSPIPDVPQRVYFEAMTTLSPGWEWPLGGSLSFDAVSTTYRFRVDVMTTAGYQIEDGEQESESLDEVIIDESADPIGDVGRGIASALSDAFDALGVFGLSIAPFLIPIIVVAAIIIVLVLVMRIMALKRGLPF